MAARRREATWGGPRRGSGRKPTGPQGAARSQRVVVMLTVSEYAVLDRLAEAQQLPLGTVAYGFVARGLRQAARRRGSQL